jgi:superoxide reductase
MFYFIFVDLPRRWRNRRGREVGKKNDKENHAMTKMLEIYKCEICGNIVEVLHTGAGDLVCCGQPMKLMEEGVVDASKEKHVPVIEKTASGYKVKVGAVPHPMEEKHYIEWIELLADGVSYKAFLKPGQVPEAEFCVQARTVSAREYCNIHGLWRKD